MLLSRRLATIFIIVVLLDPSQIESEGHRRTRDPDNGDLLTDIQRQKARPNREDKLKNNAVASLEYAQQHHLQEPHVKGKSVVHDAEEPGQEVKEHDASGKGIDSGTKRDKENLAEVSESNLEDDEEEGEGRSGDESQIDVREVHSLEDSRLKIGKRIDQHKNEGDELGYITDEHGIYHEGNDEESRSGERGRHHMHIKKLDVLKGAERSRKPHDERVEGQIKKKLADEQNESEQSGKEVYVENDLSTDVELEEGEASLLSQDEDDPSGARDLPGGNDGEEIPQKKNNGNEKEQNQEENFGDYKSEDFNSEKNKVGMKGAKDKMKGVLEERKKDPDSKGKEQKAHGNNNKRKQTNINKAEKKETQQLGKPSPGKKGKVLDEKRISQNYQKLKVQAEIHLSHEKKNPSPHGKTNKKAKSRPSNAYRDRKNQKTRNDESKSQPAGRLLGAGDFYIAESNEPEKKAIPVEIDEGINDGQYTGGKNQKLKKRAEDEYGQNFRRGNSRHLLQFTNESDFSKLLPALPPMVCIHPFLHHGIKEDAIIYLRSECRLCHCKLGQLICNRKPNHCDKHLRKHCTMTNGHLADGERHSDGCNNCICRNGELLCTRLRCFSSGYNYTNYGMLFGEQYIPEDPQKARMDERLVRGKDPCMECDDEPVEPVCGPNWKTYRSMCHAVRCGGFSVEDVKGGKCGGLFPCNNIKCGEHQICVADNRGPCLTNTDRDGNLIECPQHQCVSIRVNCITAPKEIICGENNKIYMNKCSMFTSGISLAYYGQCKLECYVNNVKMCGVDGVTFKSACHAAVHDNYVDYPGQCDDVDPKYNIDFNSKLFREYVNPRCKTVEELGKCPPVACQNYVIPEGSCCPVCGTSISIRLDTAVRDIAVNDKVQPLKDLNRVDVILIELKNQSDRFGGFNKCHLTADLVDTHDISVVFEPIKSQEYDACKEVADAIVAFINSPAKSDLEPAKAILAAAVLKDHSPISSLPRAEFMMAKRRKKRHGHHEHEPFYNASDFNEGNRIRVQLNHLLFLAFSSLFCSTNLIPNTKLI